jgi:hypothetical protein
MKFYIYKITNTINNKYYIGAHKTINENDNYFGSGKLLKRSIKKHGIENFIKEIVEYCNSESEMFERELEIINCVISDDLCMNISYGGHGGWTFVNKNKLNSRKGVSLTKEHKEKIGAASKGKIVSETTKGKMSTARKQYWTNVDDDKKEKTKEKLRKYAKNRPADHSKKISDTLKERYSVPENNPFYGKKHTEESKQKMSDALKGHVAWNKGKTHTEESKQKIKDNHKGSLGKKWINNGYDNRYINNNENIPAGWIVGMKKKK